MAIKRWRRFEIAGDGVQQSIDRLRLLCSHSLRPCSQEYDGCAVCHGDGMRPRGPAQPLEPAREVADDADDSKVDPLLSLFFRQHINFIKPR